jgi:DNA-binding response OmpR family regulator
MADVAARRTILIIEDELPNRVLMRAVLDLAERSEVREAVIREAGDLASGRVALDAEPVDLVLLDVRLPDGSGLDLLRELRAAASANTPRILILSASVLGADRDAAIAAGADAFLAKPFRPAELVDHVADLLGVVS